jgi:hypothetical protein
MPEGNRSQPGSDPHGYSQAEIDLLLVLDGTRIVADDGKFLGSISCRPASADSIANPFALFGNQFNPESIFNHYGTYGNQFSPLSPYNHFTTNPPRILRGEDFVAYLTVNAAMTPRIDPFLLFRLLGIPKWKYEDRLESP